MTKDLICNHGYSLDNLPTWLTGKQPRVELDYDLTPAITYLPSVTCKKISTKKNLEVIHPVLTSVYVPGPHNTHRFKPWQVKRSNSIEIVGGKVVTICRCMRRDGIQDRCSFSLCTGGCDCLGVPPTCPPAKAYRGQKRLDQPIEQMLANAIRPLMKRKNMHHCCCEKEDCCKPPRF